MPYFYFPVVQDSRPTQRRSFTQIFPHLRMSALVFFAILGSAALPLVDLPALAEADEAKELPRRVLRHTPPIFKEWNFETHGTATVPPEFSSETLGLGRPAEWKLATIENAPSRSHVLRQSAPCSSENCFQLFLSETVRAKYMDLSVGILADLGTPTSGAGLVFNAQDSKNFLAVLVYPATNTAKAFEFIDGKPILLKEQEVFPKKRTTWHFMRIHSTSIVSREVVELSFDNKFVMSLEPKHLKSGFLGLVTTGDGRFAFDNLRAVEITTGIPISRPPAY